jgi:hypothetical protein
MADRELALERAQALLAEHLVDQAQLALGHDVAALHARDTGGLLSAVLEGVQREVGEAGDVVFRGVDPEDAALVTRSVASVEVEARL